MQLRFIILWVLRETKASWPYFLATVLCVGCAVFTGSLVFQGKEIWRCVTPPWASQTATIVLMKPDVDEKDIEKIRQHLESSSWVESYEVFRGEKAIMDFKAMNPDLANLVEDLDPAHIPAYFKITTGERCLAEYSECKGFLTSLGSLDVVDRVYSGLVWAETVFRWFDYARRVLFISLVIFLGLGLIIAVLLIRLICESRSKELYLWKTLGASPGMMKTPFLLYSSFAVFLGNCLAWAIFKTVEMIAQGRDVGCFSAEVTGTTGLLMVGLVAWAAAITVVYIYLELMLRKRKWNARGW